MSQAQYNLNTKTDYLHRKMFLDPAGPVTIQRFEEVKYNKISDYEKTARGFFWTPEEVNLTKDANDFKDASDAVKHIFTSNLLRQTALDSLQGRGPSQIFMPVVSLPELAEVTVTSFVTSTTFQKKFLTLSMTQRRLLIWPLVLASTTKCYTN
jgi:ribonucleoside-diphosphate reductase beta chain